MTSEEGKALLTTLTGQELRYAKTAGLILKPGALPGVKPKDKEKLSYHALETLILKESFGITDNVDPASALGKQYGELRRSDCACSYPMGK
jgi:hypothetical protein